MKEEVADVPFPVEGLEQMHGFVWILMRLSILFALLPLFGARNVPMLWKAGFSFVLAIVILPVAPPPPRLPDTLPEFLLGLASEFMLGLILAFVVRLVFAAVQLAGQFMAFQMGLSMSSAMDPATGVRSTTLSQFLYLLTVLVFFSIDGHHLLVRAIAASFELVPPNGFQPEEALCGVVVKASSQMFVVALKIAAPIMIALFLSNLCLGIVARTVPQVNILMIGFPINITLGLVIFGLTLRGLPPFLGTLTRSMGALLEHLLRLM